MEAGAQGGGCFSNPGETGGVLSLVAAVQMVRSGQILDRF